MSLVPIVYVSSIAAGCKVASLSCGVGRGKEKRKENMCEPLHSLDKLAMDEEIYSVGEAIFWHVRLLEEHHNSLPTRNHND